MHEARARTAKSDDGSPDGATARAVVVENLWKSYRPSGAWWRRGSNSAPVEAVRGISFDVRPGEVFGLLGPNGAGKSTTMRILVGLSPPSAGTVSVFGLTMPGHAREVKRRLGVVPQESNLDNDMEVRDQLLAWARFYDWTGKRARDRVDDLLERFRLEEKASVRVDELSGGMKRRLLLARALIHDPDFLVMDEPTVGLDPQSRHLLWERIRELSRSGKTILLSTHYMEEAEFLCDRVAILHEGRILETGSPAEVIEANLPREVLELELPEPDRAAVAKLVPGGEVAGDRVLLPTADAEALLARLKSQAIPFTSALARRASLEDVFLKLTGRRLED
jgi:lipooligosaccharide transport system ATP-binding protein